MDRFVIVTPMKNEGPFILEWVAHNLAIGADEIVIFSNDCSDGSDVLLDRLHAMGKIRHFYNTARKLQPQRRAYRRFNRMNFFSEDAWVVPIDADEFINIKTGDHTLSALTSAVPSAGTLSMTWRVFGNAGIRAFKDEFITDQFRMAAREMTPRPAGAWGFKTMFRRRLWGGLGVHRPKLPTVERFADLHWVNGSGQPMPEAYFEKGWRSRPESIGYGLVQLNHYPLRSCESFLVKKARGRANHVNQSIGLDYWKTMNYAKVQDSSIDAISKRKLNIYEDLVSDSQLRRLHEECCTNHRKEIVELRKNPDFDALLNTLLPEKAT